MVDEIAKRADLVVTDVKEISEEVRPPVLVRFSRDAGAVALRNLSFEADWSSEIQGYVLPWSSLPVIPSDDGRFNVFSSETDEQFHLVFHRHTSIGLVVLPTTKTKGHEWDDGSAQNYDWAEMSRRRQQMAAENVSDDVSEDVSIELERRDLSDDET
jgi:hypothetical protein